MYSHAILVCTCALVFFVVVPTSTSAQATVFPPDISRFSLKYQYHDDGGNKYEYYLPGESGNDWSRLITIIRFTNNAGYADIHDLEKITTAVMSPDGPFSSEVTNMKDYVATTYIPDTRAFIIMFRTFYPERSTNKYKLEIDLEKYFVMDGYVYGNLYAEQYHPTDANDLERILSERREVLSTARDVFVTTRFPNPFTSTVPITISSPSPTTFTKIAEVKVDSSLSTNQILDQLKSQLIQMLGSLQTQTIKSLTGTTVPSD
ncbi:MAG: hypothetical protein L0287_24800, partial [Anaerolineae bacterium]|nr:hypothetical protein [Anaerolineae bacterium]